MGGGWTTGKQGNIIFASIFQELVNIVNFLIIVGLASLFSFWCSGVLLDEVANLALGQNSRCTCTTGVDIVKISGVSYFGSG
jgi:hypothetical protein